jgi:hypothetical protein
MSHVSKKKKKCEDCGGNFNHLYICKGRFLCYKCHRKEQHVICGPGPNQQIFNQPLDYSENVAVSLTKNQLRLVRLRLQELYEQYPIILKNNKKYKRQKKRISMGKYVRWLIYKDLTEWMWKGQNGKIHKN